MNLFGRHLSGLFDFSGRENREPFWLWVLIAYLAQMAMGIVLMVPLMMYSFSSLRSVVGTDPAYLDAHPELAQKMVMQAMAPMMRNMMVMTGVLSLMFVVLLAAAVVRRLHDSNRSGWWASPYFALNLVMPFAYAVVLPDFFAKMPVMKPDMTPAEANAAIAPMMQSISGLMAIGMGGFLVMIVLIVFLCLPSTPGANRFGENPLRMPPL